jgi:hypothetical protein
MTTGTPGSTMPVGDGAVAVIGDSSGTVPVSNLTFAPV